MKQPVGPTSNGKQVFVDLIHSQAAKHIAGHPQLIGHVAEALRQTTVKTAYLKFEYNLKRSIGYENVVPTAPAEKVVYAQTAHDGLYTRFTRKGNPSSTTYVSMALQQNEDGTYDLLDAWIGRIRPPRPGSDNETPASREYWANHAFLLDKQVLRPHTATETCPY